MTTTDMSIRFFAPCRTDARATAKVIKTGRTLVIAEINIHDMTGRHIAVTGSNHLSRSVHDCNCFSTSAGAVEP